MQVVHARAVERRAGGGDQGARDIVHEDQVGGAPVGDAVGPAEHRRLHGQRGRRRHPEVAPGPVDRERAEAHRSEPVLLPVDARGLFVGDLVDAVVCRREPRRVVSDGAGRVEARRAEDRRGGGVDDALDLARRGARGLEDVRRADDVDARAPRGVLAAERDLPRRQMDDAADPVLLHDADDGLAIGDVAAHRDDAPRHVGRDDHPHAPRVVGEVEDDGALARGEQSADHPRADTAERSGHQGGHELRRYHSTAETLGRRWAGELHVTAARSLRATVSPRALLTRARTFPIFRSRGAIRWRSW